jgi:hypothetical protein
MRRSGEISAVLAFVLMAVASAAPAAESAPELDPGTMAALQKMGAYLRTLTTFQVEAATTDEDVLDDGQKLQFSGSASILARAPDRLRAEVTDDRRKRLFLYDGKNFTLFAERVGYYATIAAPPTITKLVDKLDSEYGFSVPLEDLFRWGAPGWRPGAIKRAIDVGPADVEGVTCEQYALRQDDVDWQIWLQRGAYPLPRKLVITTRTDDAKPQHTAVFTWNLAPSFNDATFEFDPPPGAQRVTLLSDTGVPTASPAARATK